MDRAPVTRQKPNWTWTRTAAIPLRLSEIAMHLDGESVRLIRIEKYAATVFATPEKVREEIQSLWNSKSMLLRNGSVGRSPSDPGVSSRRLPWTL